MKLFITTLFSLLLLGQMFPAAAVNLPVTADCGCGGKMACCAQKSHSTTPAPAIPQRVGFENQILLHRLATLAVVFSPAEIPAFASAEKFAPHFAATPIFARHCLRLI